jgi:ATP-dependent DNA helicase DinG
MGLQVSQGALEHLLNRLWSHNGERGLLSYHGTRESQQQLAAVRSAGGQFFDNLRAWFESSQRGGRAAKSRELRVREAGIVPNILSEELVKLSSVLTQIANGVPDDEQKIEITSVSDRVDVLALSVRSWLDQALADQVYWLELRGERTQRLALASAPIDVGQALKENLYDKVPTIVMTSATLSASAHSSDEGRGF